MKCPSCHKDDTKVIDSRCFDEETAVRRRRECEKCGFRFSTIEEIEILNLTVVKKDRSEEPYDKEKLINSLQKALEKRPIKADKIKRVTQAIEQDIQLKEKEDKIKSIEIGEIVMRHLKKLDKVAYIRFASVYRDFEDIETFQKEITKLITSKHK